MSATLTIRHATASDAEAIERLAALDSTSAPPGAVLLAEVGDELWAAVEVDERHCDRRPVPLLRRPGRAAAAARRTGRAAGVPARPAG